MSGSSRASNMHLNHSNNRSQALPVLPFEDIVKRNVGRPAKSCLPISPLEDIVNRNAQRPAKTSLSVPPLEDIVKRNAGRPSKTSLAKEKPIEHKKPGRPVGRKPLSVINENMLKDSTIRRSKRPSKNPYQDSDIWYQTPKHTTIPTNSQLSHDNVLCITILAFSGSRTLTPVSNILSQTNNVCASGLGLSTITASPSRPPRKTHVSSRTPVKPMPANLGKTNECFTTPTETVTQVGSKTSKSTIQYGSVPVSSDIQNNKKGLGLRNKHSSRFCFNTPVKFNIGSTSSTKGKDSHGEQRPILTSFEQNLKGKMVGRKTPRCINFTTPEPEGESEVQQTAFVGISKDYIDHGDPRFECTSCGAMLWFAEKNRGASNTNSDSYSLCCMRGKVKLDVDIMKPPKLLKDLITKQHPKSSSFLENIRRYNSMFAFTSLGGTQDTSVNTGRGPYCYRLHGENKHRIGDLLPEEGKPPKFCQLYIYDTENEIRNRMQAVSNGPSTSSSNNELDYQLTTDIRDMLDSNNPLVSKLWYLWARDGRDHNLPTASEVAALIVGDFDSTKDKRDIILHRQNGNVKRIMNYDVGFIKHFKKGFLTDEADDEQADEAPDEEANNDFTTPSTLIKKVNMHDSSVNRVLDMETPSKDGSGSRESLGVKKRRVFIDLDELDTESEDEKGNSNTKDFVKVKVEPEE
ncbi:hypothetical protein Tco_0914952 [Tanacetum coccineum]